MNVGAIASAILAGVWVIVCYVLFRQARRGRDGALRAKAVRLNFGWVFLSWFAAGSTLRSPTHTDASWLDGTIDSGNIADILGIRDLVRDCGGDQLACSYAPPKLWIALSAFCFIFTILALIHCGLFAQEVIIRADVARQLSEVFLEEENEQATHRVSQDGYIVHPKTDAFNFKGEGKEEEEYGEDELSRSSAKESYKFLPESKSFRSGGLAPPTMIYPYPKSKSFTSTTPAPAVVYSLKSKSFANGMDPQLDGTVHNLDRDSLDDGE
eukprot:TRINITY_DN12156_c0_g1_i1.p1 TRINITY_DN12156_c0_g1~~TRINITY_DN12156_c0_g1_i1.p1  ORF type:complete len:268 (-),score=15.29 TRINITY_DN12156_c0_g1_i1:130-933(-)